MDEAGLLTRSHKLSGTIPQTVFEHTVDLAADIFAATIVAVSFVGLDTSWFRSQCVPSAPEIVRDFARRAEAIPNNGVCLVRDLAQDQRFKDSPYVRDMPHISFYAGAPLVTRNGHRIGTLSIIDTEPRDGFEQGQSATLKRLAALTMDEVELLLANRNLKCRTKNLAAAKRDLVMANAEVAAANHAKSEFLANMSHEIRTLLNGIIGMNALLLESELGPEPRYYAAAVGESADTLLTLVNDTLDIAKLEAGRIELENIDFDPEDVLHGVLEIFAPRATEKGIAISATVDHRVPPLVCGDPTRLRQVLSNLVNNAVKFTEHGQVQARLVPVDDNPERTCLRFEIQDTGIGLSSEQQACLFRKFAQVDSSVARQFGGTGLGLAISRELVALMGGNIGVKSEPGTGSTFWFTVRMRPTLTASLVVDRVFLVGRRALVVADTKADRYQLRRVLERTGLKVSEAADAFSAFAALEQAWLRREPFELVFFDHVVAGIPVQKFAESVRQHERFAQIRLVMVRASGASRQGADADTNATVDALLSRPVRRRALHELLADLFKIDEIGAGDANRGRRLEASSLTPTRSRVLVADDNSTNRDIVAALLAREGIEMDIVTDGAGAVEAVQRGQYALVLMDVEMPVLDGLRATQCIRALPSNKSCIPIIAMTAHAMRTDRERCLAAGMTAYVSKPIETASFLETVHRLLYGHSLQRESKQQRRQGQAHPGDRTSAIVTVLDEARVAGLASMLCGADLGSMFERWQADNETAITRMQMLVEQNDYHLLARAAHEMHGTAATIGAVQIANFARALMESCEKQDDEGTRYYTAALREEASNTWPQIRQRLLPASDCSRDKHATGSGLGMC